MIEIIFLEISNYIYVYVNLSKVISDYLITDLRILFFYDFYIKNRFY